MYDNTAIDFYPGKIYLLYGTCCNEGAISSKSSQAENALAGDYPPEATAASGNYDYIYEILSHIVINVIALWQTPRLFIILSPDLALERPSLLLCRPHIPLP